MRQLGRRRPSPAMAVQFSDNAGGTLEDFVAPPDAYQAYLIDAIFMPGTTAPCAASLLAGRS